MSPPRRFYYESQSRSFQNSKYNSSSRYSNYYRDREASPPKRIAHRSVSPEGSPRDGRDRYHQSSSYRNKDREREYKKDKYSEKRGRDRDIEYKNYNSKKAKTRDRSSSDDEHKEERLYEKRYSDRDSVRRPLEKERRFGDWKEMISKGSGKKYYYNERDKSSQWEKPEEWTEYEMQKEYPRGYREKERERKNRDDRYNSRRSYNSKHSRGNSRVRWPHDSYPSTSSSMSHSRRDGDNADMEISPDSTPTSEKSYASPSGNINSASIAEDPAATASSPNGHVPSKHHNNQSSTSSKQNSKQNSTAAASSSPSTHHNYHSSHHHRHRSVSPVDTVNDTNNSNSIRNSPAYGSNNNVTGSNNHLIGDGPPTPEMDLNSGGDHRRIDGVPGGGVSSLQSVMSATTVSNRLNLLTPSLAKFFRVDLLSHVTNWPSELLEKQAQKCAEDVYLLGDLECSRISAEIQCARSIVRVAEIAATIQGQRRLFLQEQIKEEQKPNAY